MSIELHLQHIRRAKRFQLRGSARWFFSNHVSRMTVAAKASSGRFFRLPRPPPISAIRSRASKLESRSSCNSTTIPVCLPRRFAKFRARVAILPSLPSILSGSPTITRSTWRAESIRWTASTSAERERRSITAKGRGTRPSGSLTASPIRRVPRSIAATAITLGTRNASKRNIAPRNHLCDLRLTTPKP